MRPMTEEDNWDPQAIYDYPAVGRCIYCGATRYDEHTVTLRDEHIVPLGIHGQEYLPEASCRSCEGITGRWEQIWQRGNIDPIRQHFGLQDKRRQKRREKEGKTSMPVYHPKGRTLIPWQDYPAIPVFPVLGAPRLFNPLPPFHHPEYRYNLAKEQMSIMASRYNLHQFTTLKLDTWAFMRVLAKIAHAYTVAILGLGSFIPLLPNYIIGDNDGARHFYVGSDLDIEPQTDLLHDFRFEPATVEQWEFIVLRIRLFANLGAPTYRVVSGLYPAPTKPLELQLAEAGILSSPLGIGAPYRSGLPIPAGLWDPNAPSLRGAPAQPPQRYTHAKITLTVRNK